MTNNSVRTSIVFMGITPFMYERASPENRILLSVRIYILIVSYEFLYFKKTQIFFPYFYLFLDNVPTMY